MSIAGNATDERTMFDFFLIVLFVVLALVAGPLSGAGNPEEPPRRQRAGLRQQMWSTWMAGAALAVFAVWNSGIEPLIIAVALFVVSPLQYLRPYIPSEMLRNYIHEPSLCGRCEYNLTGNVSGICPECGWRIPKDVKEIALQDYWWQQWWKWWPVDHLDSPGALLAAQVAASIAAVAATLLCAIYDRWIFSAVFIAFGVHCSVNAVRVWQYCRRNRPAADLAPARVEE